MKPQLLKVSTAPINSFSVRQDMLPNINNRWHYHSEVELVHLHQGQGTQFVGDSIKRFHSGDIVLVGSNLPHYWKFDEGQVADKTNSQPFSTVVHFSENFWGDRFMNLPETKVIRTILEKARRGLLLREHAGNSVGKLIAKIRSSEGLERLIALMECLSALANCEAITTLSSIGFHYNFSDAESDRINAIYNYSFQHFHRKIELEEIADVAGLVPNSFCRYFKSRTGKTYSQFLLEIRIGYACKLIIENKMNTKQLCFESGFNNFSCFHKKFKLITGKTPLAYQREFIPSRL